MPLASPDLDAAFEACRRETAEWAKTFYIGTLLLPSGEAACHLGDLCVVPAHG